MFKIAKICLKGLILGVITGLCALSAQKDINSVRISAERGDPIAQTELADFYRAGQGVPQNAELALKWYRLAGEQDYSAAQVSLGTMYHLENRGQTDVF